MMPSPEPWWVKIIVSIGVPTFFLLWMMGAFDGVLASPITTAIRKHDETTQSILRLICSGTWRGDPAAQRECLHP
jgi:hypothetical protein